eukprot:750414-Hanusia_phi.AAC.2
MSDDREGLVRGINILSKITTMRDAVRYVNVCHPQGLVRENRRSPPLLAKPSHPNNPQQPLRSTKLRVPPLQLQSTGASRPSKSFTSRDREFRDEEAEDWSTKLSGRPLAVPGVHDKFLGEGDDKEEVKRQPAGSSFGSFCHRKSILGTQPTSSKDCGYRHAVLVEGEG